MAEDASRFAAGRYDFGVAEGHERYFTREEAEALLPEVDRLLAQAQTLATRLAAAAHAAKKDEWLARRNGHARGAAGGAAAPGEHLSSAEALAAAVERVQALGVVVRDVRAGLIDFPSLREGRVVHLCWRRGEPLELRWWHEVEAGFAGRQPLD